MIEQHGTRQLYRALNMTRQGIAVVASHNLEGVEVSWLFLPESNRELRAKAVCIDTDLKFHLNIRSTSDHFLFCHLSDFIWRYLFYANDDTAICGFPSVCNSENILQQLGFIIVASVFESVVVSLKI